MDASAAPDIAALRALAERRLPRFVFDYLEGGAGSGRGRARNQAMLEAITLLPRVLQDVARVETATTLFGQALAAPILVAPTGVAGLLRPGADLMLARAAAASGLPFILSAASNMPVEQVAAAGGQIWMQIYPLRDPEAAARLAARASAAGCVGLVLTLDTPVAGIRHWDAQHLHASGRPRLRTWLDALRHPRWLAATLRHGAPRFPNIDMDMPPAARTSRAERAAINNGKDPSFTAESLARFRDAWPRRLIVKGLLAPEDVALVARLGADAAVLSNHGGRQLDDAAAPVEMLMPCRDAAGTMTLLLDGGIREGGSIAKVLAMGAAGVLVGRAPLYGIAAGGEAGAARALAILVRELRGVMALLGCTHPAALAAQHVRLPPGFAGTASPGSPPSPVSAAPR